MYTGMERREKEMRDVNFSAGGNGVSAPFEHSTGEFDLDGKDEVTDGG